MNAVYKLYELNWLNNVILWLMMDDFKTQSCTLSDLIFTHTTRDWIQTAWELSHWGRMEMEPSTGTSMELVCTKKSLSSGMQRRIGKCFFTLLSTIYSLILFLCGWQMSIVLSCKIVLSCFMFAWALPCNYSWHWQLLFIEGYHLEVSIVLLLQQWTNWINITRPKEKGKTTKEKKTRRPSAEVR